METKACAKCGRTKPLTEYHRNRNRPDGRQVWCKPCHNHASREWARQARERHHAAIARKTPPWKSALAEHYRRYGYSRRIYTANHGAAARGAEGFFTGKEIEALYDEQGGRCTYCSRRLGKGHKSPHAYHIDHVIPVSRGGTNWISNIQLLCPSCNARKHDKTHEEFVRHLAECGHP